MKGYTTRTYFILGVALLISVFIINLNLGSVRIPVKTTFQTLFNQPIDNESWQYIILHYRLPKAVTAILVGSGLALSGLLMQTLFRNPLADPFVLGLSSGASLGVALVIMGSGLLSAATNFLLSDWGVITAASVGSFIVMLAVLVASFRLKNTMGILIIGIMFAAFTGAVVSILSYFSSSEELQTYIFWSFGSLGNLTWAEVGMLSLFWLIGMGLSVFSIKNLNALFLGEHYAKSMGVNLNQNRFAVIVITSLLTGSITAFAGPIAFIGLAVPHMVRLFIKKNSHYILIPAVGITGSIIMLICDTIAQLPGSTRTLPINAITSLFGAPVVIWLLLRKKKLIF